MSSGCLAPRRRGFRRMRRSSAPRVPGCVEEMGGTLTRGGQRVNQRGHGAEPVGGIERNHGLRQCRHRDEDLIAAPESERSQRIRHWSMSRIKSRYVEVVPRKSQAMASGDGARRWPPPRQVTSG